jgi:LacI family transcriptional regulator
MTTIKDIAKQADVAASTVSYVLNNTKNVKPETKERILKVIKELHYQPSAVARSLKTKKSLTIGIMIPDISNMFFTEIVRGIEDIANEYEYNVILCNTDEDEKKEKRYLDNLYNKHIDGLIFVGTGKNQQILKDKQHIPVVAVDRKIGYNFGSVMVDNVKGAYIATNYLLEKNGADVILLTGPLSLSTYFERMTGYIEALREKGLEYNENIVRECPVGHEGGYTALEDLLEKNVGLRSIFASNDLIALGAMKALIKRGVRIPEEVSIVGYDDIPTASIITPALTTIQQPKYNMGRKAAELLLNSMTKQAVKERHIVLEPKLVIRETA